MEPQHRHQVPRTTLLRTRRRRRRGLCFLHPLLIPLVLAVTLLSSRSKGRLRGAVSRDERLRQEEDRVKNLVISAEKTGPSQPRPASVSRTYTFVNALKDPTYSDYENHHIEWNQTKHEYSIEKVIGRGKFSEVFLGTHRPSGDRVVIKCLKPVQKHKLQREHKVLTTLQGGPNIVKFRDCVEDDISLPAFVFDYVNTSDWKQLFPKLNDMDIRHYMYQLLIALKYCHKRGIIHRDVKPHNMVIDHGTKQLRLIDFGLAEFYHPGQEYNTRVASRHYKGPELLACIRDYDYSLDIWSFGCVLASLVFMKVPFFAGSDNYDQMKKVAKVLGTDEMYEYLDKYHAVLDPRIQKIMGRYPRRPWSKFISEATKEKANPEALDLIDKCLKYDHQERLTVKEALAHPYFDPVRNGHPEIVSQSGPNPQYEDSQESQSDIDFQSNPFNPANRKKFVHEEEPKNEPAPMEKT